MDIGENELKQTLSQPESENGVKIVDFKSHMHLEIVQLHYLAVFGLPISLVLQTNSFCSSYQIRSIIAVRTVSLKQKLQHKTSVIHQSYQSL